MVFSLSLYLLSAPLFKPFFKKAKLQSRGRKPPGRGFGGCAPKNQKRGRVVHISNPATSGAQNADEPKAHEGGQTGVQGAQAPWQGVWGMCPQKPKEGASRPH